MTRNNDLATAGASALTQLGTSTQPTAGSRLLRGLLLSAVLLLCIGAAALGMVQPAQTEPIPPEQSLVQNVLPFPLSADPTSPKHAFALAIRSPQSSSGSTLPTQACHPI